MIAIIDVGSNSVRLMTWADGTVLFKRIATTRLGEGISSGFLQEESMARTAKAIAEFCRQAKEMGAKDVYAFATAAVRSAKNKEQFCQLVFKSCGISLDVVSGEEEAELGLCGALGECSNGGMIDVGGASTEVSVRQNGRTSYKKSINLGAVRLFSACGQQYDKLLADIQAQVDAFCDCPTVPFFGVGGTATTLAALQIQLEVYDGKKIQGVALTQDDVLSWAKKLCTMTQEARLQLQGMDKRRADIIGGGALLLGCVMRAINIDKIFVSDSDNLEGYLFRRVLQ